MYGKTMDFYDYELRRHRIMRVLDRWVNVLGKDPADPRIDRILTRVGYGLNPNPDPPTITGGPSSNTTSAHVMAMPPPKIQHIHNTYYSQENYSAIIGYPQAGKHIEIYRVGVSVDVPAHFQFFANDMSMTALSLKTYVEGPKTIWLRPEDFITALGPPGAGVLFSWGAIGGVSGELALVVHFTET